MTWVIKLEGGQTVPADMDAENLPSLEERPLSYWIGQGGQSMEFQSRICLLKIPDLFSIEMMKLFPHWERGVMPFPGSLLEQPQIVRDAMEIIAGARANLKRD
jgi:hypothetical protein